MKTEEQFPGRAIAPGLHALIVGVSDYPHLSSAAGTEPSPSHHLGLRKLSSAATAAYNLYSYLVKRADYLAVPLATCRLLLSPSPLEASKVADSAPRASMENLEAAASAWRNDARTDPRNVTLFYFAGHGLQRTRGGQVLLLEDFGASTSKLLRRCLEASNLVEGMGSTSEKDTMARTQLYFFDACRTLPSEILKYDELNAETIWDLPRPDPEDKYVDTRFAPMFYTCVPGSEAFGIEGIGSVFGEALLLCLKGGAGTFDQQSRQWSVTVNSLSRALGPQLTIVNREYQTTQMFRVSDTGPDAPLHHLDGPPDVEIEITLNPPEKRTHAKILVVDEKRNPVLDLGAPVPEFHREKVPAGTYDVSAIADVRLLVEEAKQLEAERIRWLRSAVPPSSAWPLQLE